MTLLQMLDAAERQNRSLLCVGLDQEPTPFLDRLKPRAAPPAPKPDNLRPEPLFSMA